MFIYVHWKKKLSLNSSNNSYPVSEGFSFSLKRSDSFTVLENPLEFSSLSKYVFVVQSVVAPISMWLSNPEFSWVFFLAIPWTTAHLEGSFVILNVIQRKKMLFVFFNCEILFQWWHHHDRWRTQGLALWLWLSPRVWPDNLVINFFSLFPRFTFILSWNFAVNQVEAVIKAAWRKAMLNDHNTLTGDIENAKCLTCL